MRISVVVVNLEGGGKEKAAILLANGFAKRGIKTDLVVLSRTGAYCGSGLISKQVNVRYFFRQAPKIRIARYLRSIYYVRPFLKYMRECKPDVCITFWGVSDWLGALERRVFRPSMKLIFTIHDTPSVYEKLGGRYAWKRWVDIIKCRLADKIVIVSNASALDAKRYYYLPEQKISVIYNPIVTPEILQMAQAEPKHSWFKLSACPVILSTGSLIPLKNHTILIQAFAEVRKRRECKLLILGEGEERKKLELLIENLSLEKDVSMPGFGHNPYAYMRNASVSVLPSLTEALPNVIIEALACGCPVIATDCPGGSAEILRNGKYGILVPVNDIPAMAKAISQVLEGKYPCTKEERIARGMEFNVDASVTEYIKLIKDSRHA